MHPMVTRQKYSPRTVILDHFLTCHVPNEVTQFQFPSINYDLNPLIALLHLNNYNHSFLNISIFYRTMEKYAHIFMKGGNTIWGRS